MKYHRSVLTLILFLIGVFLYDEFRQARPLTDWPLLPQRKIWASMCLCYSHNTEKYGKVKYPYKEVAPLALLLWRYHVPQVSTIVRIIYTEPELNSFMKYYGEKLERTGAVVEWLPAGDMDCVLKSQLIRSLVEGS